MVAADADADMQTAVVIAVFDISRQLISTGMFAMAHMASCIAALASVLVLG